MRRVRAQEARSARETHRREPTSRHDTPTVDGTKLRTRWEIHNRLTTAGTGQSHASAASRGGEGPVGCWLERCPSASTLRSSPLTAPPLTSRPEVGLYYSSPSVVSPPSHSELLTSHRPTRHSTVPQLRQLVLPEIVKLGHGSASPQALRCPEHRAATVQTGALLTKYRFGHCLRPAVLTSQDSGK